MTIHSFAKNILEREDIEGFRRHRQSMIDHTEATHLTSLGSLWSRMKKSTSFQITPQAVVILAGGKAWQNRIMHRFISMCYTPEKRFSSVWQSHGDWRGRRVKRELTRVPWRISDSWYSVHACNGISLMMSCMHSEPEDPNNQIRVKCDLSETYEKPFLFSLANCFVGDRGSSLTHLNHQIRLGLHCLSK